MPHEPNKIEQISKPQTQREYMSMRQREQLANRQLERRRAMQTEESNRNCPVQEEARQRARVTVTKRAEREDVAGRIDAIRKRDAQIRRSNEHLDAARETIVKLKEQIQQLQTENELQREQLNRYLNLSEVGLGIADRISSISDIFGPSHFGHKDAIEQHVADLVNQVIDSVITSHNDAIASSVNRICSSDIQYRENYTPHTSVACDDFESMLIINNRPWSEFAAREASAD